MRLRKLIAAALAICMVAVLLPTTAFAGDFLFNDSAVKGDTITLTHSINAPNTDPIRLVYNFQPKAMEIATKDGIAFKVQLSRSRAEILPYRADGKELDPDNLGVIDTTMKITLADGSVVDRYKVKLTLDDKIAAKLTVLDADNVETDYSEMLKGETYTLKLEMVDKSNASSADRWKDSYWTLSEVMPEGAVELGTPSGSYPVYYNTMTFVEDGSVYLQAGFSHVGSGHTGMGRTFSTLGSKDDPSGFYFLYTDRYGVEVDEAERNYPNSTINGSWSVNRTYRQMNGRDFVSDKKPVSVRAADPNHFDFELHDIEKKGDGKYYGLVSYRLKKEVTGKTEWLGTDVGQTYQSNSIITFSDGSTAKFNYALDTTELPLVTMEQEGRRVQAGKTYTQNCVIRDKADVLDDNTKAIATWNVITGKEKIALGASGISMPTTGTVTEIKNNITFANNVRGDVHMEVNFTNNPIINRPNNSGGGVDTNKNIGGDRSFTYIVDAPAQPMTAEKAAEVSSVEGGKLVVSVPSINTLPIATLNAIGAAAADKDCQRVELKIHDRVTMGLGASSLDMSSAGNAAFLQAVDKNGGFFDPLVIQAAPDSAAENGLATDTGYWLDFAHEGALPIDTVMTVDVEDIFNGYENLSLWHYNESTGKLEPADDIAVDFDGRTCTFPLEHCSTWVLLPEVEGYNPNPGGEGGDDNPGTSSGGDGQSPVYYPTVEQGLATLSKITELNASTLPTGVKLAKTYSGKDIAVLPVSLNAGGSIGIGDMASLGKLPGNVGLLIRQGGGAAEIILPGGFTTTPEPGRFSYPLLYEAKAPNSADMLSAVKGEAVISETCKLGGDLTLPVTATVQLATKIREGSTVRIYRYSPATGKCVLVSSGKSEGGKVRFATQTLGQFIVTTGQI